MKTESINKCPILILKDCIAEEFKEILGESRVQHLMLLLDRINNAYLLISDKEIKADLSYHIDLLNRDNINFSESLEKLRKEVKI